MRRILVYTGKGGTGKTTIAAATAALVARRGIRTLAISTDPAHSLGDAYDCKLEDNPIEIAPNLFGRQVEGTARLEKDWGVIRNQAAALLDWAGADSLDAEELAILPGLEELFTLADLVDYYRKNEYDAVIVDAAPTAETLRLLAIPEILRWWMSTVWPVGRGLAKVVRPVVTRVSSMPFASDEALDAAEDLYERILAAHGLLSDPSITSVRLVFNAEKVVLAETRRTYTYLCLFGYPVDAIIANKLVSSVDGAISGESQLLESLRQREMRWIEQAKRDFEGMTMLECPYCPEEPVGVEKLVRLGENVYRDLDPLATYGGVDTMEMFADGNTAFLRIFLPLTKKKDIDVYRKGSELYVRVGEYTRNIHLPHSLARRKLESARYRDSRLVIAFSGNRTRAEAFSDEGTSQEDRR